MDFTHFKKFFLLMPLIIATLGSINYYIVGIFAYLHPLVLAILFLIVKKLIGIETKKNFWEVLVGFGMHFSMLFSIIAGIYSLLVYQHVFITISASTLLILAILVYFASVSAIIIFSFKELGIEKKEEIKLMVPTAILQLIVTIFLLGLISNNFNFFPSAEQLSDALPKTLQSASANPGIPITFESMIYGNTLLSMREFETYYFDYRQFELDKDFYRIDSLEIKNCKSSENIECNPKQIRVVSQKPIRIQAMLICRSNEYRKSACIIDFKDLPGVPTKRLVNGEYYLRAKNPGFIQSKSEGIFINSIMDFYYLNQNFEKMGYLEKIYRLFSRPTLFELVVDQINGLAFMGYSGRIKDAVLIENYEIQMSSLHGDYFTDGTSDLDAHLLKLEQKIEIEKKKAADKSVENLGKSNIGPFIFTEISDYIGLEKRIMECTRYYSKLQPPNSQEKILQQRAILACYQPIDDELLAQTRLKYSLANGARWLSRNPEFYDTLQIRISYRGEFNPTTVIDFDEIEQLSGTKIITSGERKAEYHLYSTINLKIVKCDDICTIEVIE
ncbi:hypothetical protein HY989_01370 [Candidatus Micrarchaeota archaeon]|nr:hypothetical protein [Candidatus Micrarchaeota archaeon]